MKKEQISVLPRSLWTFNDCFCSPLTEAISTLHILQRVAVGSEEQNVEAHTANLWSKNNLWITSPIDTLNLCQGSDFFLRADRVQLDSLVAISLSV